MKIKKILLMCLLFIAGGTMTYVSAQDVTVEEPDSTSSDLIYLVTVDNQLKAMPFGKATLI